jgi:hypothetical protein
MPTRFLDLEPAFPIGIIPALPCENAAMRILVGLVTRFGGLYGGLRLRSGKWAGLRKAALYVENVDRADRTQG